MAGESELEQLIAALEQGRSAWAGATPLPGGLYRAVVEELPAIVYLEVPDGSDPNGFRDIYISPKIQEWLGYTPEEWTSDSSNWIGVIHPEDRLRVTRETERTTLSGEPYRTEYRMRAKDGRTLWLHDEATLVRDERGNPLYWQGFMLDVTDQKELEEVQAQLAKERAISDGLRELNEMKDTFLTAVSHDFRTPLAAVMGLAITMAREEVSLSEQEVKDFSRRIAANARKLEGLVSDLLDLDRLVRGTIGLDAGLTDVGSLVAKVVEGWNLSSSSEDRPVEVRAETVVIPADGTKVERMVENLLANATKHTPPGTRVWVSVVAHEGGAMIIVDDEGPGIADDIKVAVFEPFRQGSQPTPSPGVGIGLSLVARFAELHGGRAWVEDREGGGASFRISLPGEAT